MATLPMVQVKLYTVVQSIHDLHSHGPSALGSVDSLETCTMVYIKGLVHTV